MLAMSPYSKIFLSALLLPSLGFGAHAFLFAGHTLDRWSLEQTPAELLSKHNIAADLSTVDNVRGMRSRELIVLRLESKDCIQHFCRTIVIRDCENSPCPQLTILAGPNFLPTHPSMAFVPGAYSMAFEGMGKKTIFVIVAPTYIMVSTLY